MRLGILGGSFDPPHVGHQLVAQDALAQLDLDRLFVIPAGTQPLKLRHETRADDRLAMTRLCFERVPRVEVDAVEIERGGLSFMVDTVEGLRRRFADASFHLLIGDDVVPTLPRWHEPERLLSLVEVVVFTRFVADAGETLASDPQNRFRRLATRRVDVSSTEIRERVRDGLSLRGFVPDAVAEYIASTGLYQSESASSDPQGA